MKSIPMLQHGICIFPYVLLFHLCTMRNKGEVRNLGYKNISIKKLRACIIDLKWNTLKLKIRKPNIILNASLKAWKRGYCLYIISKYSFLHIQEKIYKVLSFPCDHPLDINFLGPILTTYNIIIIKISQNPSKSIKYLWNNSIWHRFGMQFIKFPIHPFHQLSIFLVYTYIQIHSIGAIFIVKPYLKKSS